MNDTSWWTESQRAFARLLRESVEATGGIADHRHEHSAVYRLRRVPGGYHWELSKSWPQEVIHEGVESSIDTAIEYLTASYGLEEVSLACRL